MRIFWKKTVKIASASVFAYQTPHVVTPAYCYNFAEFVFSTKCDLLP